MRLSAILAFVVVAVFGMIHQTNMSMVANPGVNTAAVAAPRAYAITGGEIVTVEGFQVHSSLAPGLAALLQAAKRDGISLSGWAYRDHLRQHQLRRINGCPNDGSWFHTPNENPSSWSSASRCRVPTARPGSSMHETGLAIDFTCAGQRFAGSRCWQWFNETIVTSGGQSQRRANSYGLYNLPSEPWHWSVNGR